MENGGTRCGTWTRLGIQKLSSKIWFHGIYGISSTLNVVLTAAERRGKDPEHAEA